jgi:hypothetical protein|tara:strand:- start:106 stop:336 length:231 start_codon:yes stop_codon:yes gene_type:complete
MDLNFLSDTKLSDKIKKHKLGDLKQDYLNRIQILAAHESKLNSKIIAECNHDYVMERESCQYGERYYVCKNCGNIR